MKHFPTYIKNYFLYSLILLLSLASCSKKNTQSNNDTSKPYNRIILDSAYKVKKNQDTTLFKVLNQKGLDLSIESRDTFGIADAYWNFGVFYYNDNEQLDSSYFYFNLAKKHFEAIGSKKHVGKMLFNMAVIQEDVDDFTGCEINIFKAINMFDETKHQTNLYRCYNTLGIMHNNLGEVEKSIEAHKKAIYYLNEVKKKRTFLESSYNNIGRTYEQAKEHLKAISFFDKALKNDSVRLKKLNISLYAKLIDNRAYNKLLLKDTLGILKEFNRALRIRDSLNYKSGILINKLHIAEYLVLKQDTVAAIDKIQEAYSLAREVDNYRDQLHALKLLSTLDKKNATTYFKQYAHINDSLKIKDRRTRDKFTRISYETDRFIEEADKQKRDKVLVSVIGFISISFLIALFYIYFQNAKTRRLALENEQQDNREKIYQLMLQQEYMHQEGKKEERMRISEDLHDGVLGSLYGTRMGLGFLDIEGDKESMEKFEEYLDDIQKAESEIRSISHALKSELFTTQSSYIDTLKKYLENVNTAESKLSISIVDESKLNWDEIDQELKINIFRIIQEAYYNVIKYANANEFSVNFIHDEENIKLIIEDDGKGFDVKKKGKGIGLKNMRERMLKFGGSVEVLSQLNNGTQIVILAKKHNS